MQRWLLVGVLVGSLAAFGGTYDWATTPIFLAAVAVAVASPRGTFSFPHYCRSLDLALIALGAAIAIQLVPLPPALAAVISPHAATVRGALRVDSALAEGRWYALSLDPRATAAALLTYLSAVLVFWSARATFSAGGVRRFCRVLALIGFVLSVEALAQRVLSPQLIYGFWRPTALGAQPFGPFVNRNYLAGWLLMALPLVLGYLAARVRTRTSGNRPLGVVGLMVTAGASLVIASTTMLVTLLATFSRSALLGLGAAAVSAWRLARPRVQGTPNAAVPTLAIAGFVLVILMTAVDLDSWARRLSSTFAPTETGRLTIWRESLPAAADFWVAGTGAGTYSMTMLRYQQSVVPLPHLGTVAHFNQAHSHYVQVAVEGGLLLGVPAVFAVFALIGVARKTLAADRGEAMWIRVGAAAALAGMAVQSVWETSLLMPANALLCATIAGMLTDRRVSAHGDGATKRR